MDGLECSEVMLGASLTSTNYFRLEPEFYNAKSLPNVACLNGNDVTIDIQYGTSKYCDENCDGFPVLRLNELSDGFILKPQKYCHIISKAEFEALKLQKGDVLIIRTNGNPDLVGRAAVVMENTEYAYASYLYRIVVNDKINAETLVSYLNGKYGRLEINKHSMKGNQTNFSPAKFRDIKIPLLNETFQSKVKEAMNIAYTLVKKADAIYIEAKTELQTSLGFNNDEYGKSYTEKFISESFGTSGRLDAEYYQPKYEAITKKLIEMRSGLLKNSCRILDANYIPVPNKNYKYIELSNIGSSGEITGCTVEAGKNLPTRARRIVHTGNVIVSSIEGSLQSCALVTKEYDNALCSTGFYVLNSEELNSETLLVLFKSEPIQELLKQQCSGTILTAFSKDGLQSIPLPSINEGMQQTIAEKIQSSFALRKQAKKLLAVAVRAVEIAIEDSEDAAMEYLEVNGK